MNQNSKEPIAHEEVDNSATVVDIQKSINGSATLENWKKAKEALAKMKEQNNKAASSNDKRNNE